MVGCVRCAWESGPILSQLSNRSGGFAIGRSGISSNQTEDLENVMKSFPFGVILSSERLKGMQMLLSRTPGFLRFLAVISMHLTDHVTLFLFLALDD